jgi:hypothetical protein
MSELPPDPAGDTAAAAASAFDEMFGEFGWTDADLHSYNGWSIRQAVIAIAAGGEAAAVRNAISAHTMSPPFLDPATGKVTDLLLDRCMAVIAEARRRAGTTRMRELRWAPWSEFGDLDVLTAEPPAYPVTIIATGFLEDTVIVYWGDPAAPPPGAGILR